MDFDKIWLNICRNPGLNKKEVAREVYEIMLSRISAYENKIDSLVENIERLEDELILQNAPRQQNEPIGFDEGPI